MAKRKARPEYDAARAVIAGRKDWDARTPWAHAPVDADTWFDEPDTIELDALQQLEFYWDGYYSGANDRYRLACEQVTK